MRRPANGSVACAPTIPHGTTGTSSPSTSETAPGLPSISRPSRLMPPSGNTPSTSPRPSACLAARSASRLLPRGLSGIARIQR
jgi:hypothetical protein